MNNEERNVAPTDEKPVTPEETTETAEITNESELIEVEAPLIIEETEVDYLDEPVDQSESDQNEAMPMEQDELVDEYYETKEIDHQRIESLIEQAENELADLRLRKSIMEADFDELCRHYQQLIIGNQDISTIAKKTLLEYYAYEFLKPLRSIGLTPTDNYNVWQTKHFFVKFQLNEEQAMDLYFKLNPINSQYESQYLPLLTIYSDKKEVQVNDHQILHLLRQWYTDKIFTVNQLSLFNYDVNLLLNHFRDCSFTVSPSLIDNTQELAVNLETEFPSTTEILDQIFIITMENPEYDFIKIAEEDYEILLDKKQRITIQRAAETTHLFIDSGQWKRSLLDFFTSYEFLVPLVVPS
jgi:hypothetical protein